MSCRAKAAIVARDERETGDRMLLNLGHTFGHAFEAAAGFSDKLLHGEAVGLGMSLAFEFSARRGLIPKAEADRVIAHLAAAVRTPVMALFPLTNPRVWVPRGPAVAANRWRRLNIATALAAV